MDGVDGVRHKRRSFKERLGFIRMGCCGATWRFRSQSIIVRHEDQQRQQQQQPQWFLCEADPSQDPNSLGPECLGPTQVSSSMNLAAALAAERQLRGPQEADAGSGRGGGRVGRSSAPGTPWRVSLMRLLEEMDCGDTEVVAAAVEEKGGVVEGNDSVCCVCLGKKKGATFIPCGHTFCWVCSRELWLNRGSSSLCNRSIIKILDIF